MSTEERHPLKLRLDRIITETSTKAKHKNSQEISHPATFIFTIHDRPGWIGNDGSLSNEKFKLIWGISLSV